MEKTVLWLVLFIPFLLCNEASADSSKGKKDYYGEKHGIWEEFQGESKKAWLVTTYRHGVMNGPSHALFPESGNTNWRTVFKDGKHHGLYVENYDNAQNSKKLEGKHINGNRSGKWTEWHANSQLHFVMNYIDGTLQGPAEYSNTSGSKHNSTVYKDGAHNGPYQQYYDNAENTLRMEGNHVKGKRSGKWTGWYDNRQIESVVNYLQDQADGPAEYFYYTGTNKKHYVTNYKQGKQHGPYAEYYENVDNVRRYQGGHRDNKKDGLWTEWHDNGFIASTKIYRDDKLHGPFKTFSYHMYEEGEPVIKTSYKDGKLHGPYVQYFDPAPFPILPTLGAVVEMVGGKERTRPKQVQKITGNYKNGNKVGEWIRWHADGKKSLVSPYRNGKLHGVELGYRMQLSRLNIGSHLYSESTYKDGVRDGRSIEYWSDGITRRFQRTYSNGKKHGPTREWHENGKIYLKGQFTKNEKDGVWEEFDDEEKPVKTYTYKMGKLVAGSDP